MCVRSIRRIEVFIEGLSVKGINIEVEWCICIKIRSRLIIKFDSTRDWKITISRLRAIFHELLPLRKGRFRVRLEVLSGTCLSIVPRRSYRGTSAYCKACDDEKHSVHRMRLTFAIIQKSTIAMINTKLGPPCRSARCRDENDYGERAVPASSTFFSRLGGDERLKRTVRSPAAFRILRSGKINENESRIFK